MRMVRFGDKIYIDVEAATRLQHYVDLAYNELYDDKEKSENSLLSRMLQDVITHQEVYHDLRIYAPDTEDFMGCNSHHYAACRSCTDPMRGMYAQCPLAPLEVLTDGKT